jgi:hypothetical protein
VTRRRRLHPLLAAVLATLTAASAVLAAEAPTTAPAADLAGTDQRVIVVLAPQANAAAEASAARDAGIEVGRTYSSTVSGFSATVSPTEERRLAAVG